MNGYNPSISSSFNSSYWHPSNPGSYNTPFLYQSHKVSGTWHVFDIPLKTAWPNPPDTKEAAENYANLLGNGLILRLIFHPDLSDRAEWFYYTFGFVESTNWIVGKIMNAWLTDFNSFLPAPYTLNNGMFAYLWSASPIFVKSVVTGITVKPSDWKFAREMPSASEYPSDAGISSVPWDSSNSGNYIYRTGIYHIAPYYWGDTSDTAYWYYPGISSRAGLVNWISLNPQWFSVKTRTVARNQSASDISKYPVYKVADNVADYNFNQSSVSGTYQFLQYYGSCYQQQGNILSKNYINNYFSVSSVCGYRFIGHIDKNAVNTSISTNYYNMSLNLPFTSHSSYGITGFMSANSSCIDDASSVSYFNNGQPIISSINKGPITIGFYPGGADPINFYKYVFRIDDYHFAWQSPSGNVVVSYIPAHWKVCLSDDEQYIVIKSQQ